MNDKGILVNDEQNVLMECGVKEVLFLSYPIGSFFCPKGEPGVKYEVKAVGLDDFGNVIYWTRDIGHWESWESDEMEEWKPTIMDLELETEYDKMIERELDHDEPDGIPC